MPSHTDSPPNIVVITNLKGGAGIVKADIFKKG